MTRYFRLSTPAVVCSGSVLAFRLWASISVVGVLTPNVQSCSWQALLRDANVWWTVTLWFQTRWRTSARSWRRWTIRDTRVTSCFGLSDKSWSKRQNLCRASRRLFESEFWTSAGSRSWRWPTSTTTWGTLWSFFQQPLFANHSALILAFRCAVKVIGRGGQ